MRWIQNPFFKPPASPSSVPETDPEAPPPPPPPPELPTDSSASSSAAVLSHTLPSPSSPPSPSSSPPPLTTTNNLTQQQTHQTQTQTQTHQPQLLRRPTPKFTHHQLFYIFILDGLGAALLSGGINFAVAYAMYTTSSQSVPITLWQLPNTLAGDAAVTIVLQNVITWLVELVLVNRDLASGGVAPIGFVRQPGWKPLRWFLFLDRVHHSNSNDNLDSHPGSDTVENDNTASSSPVASPGNKKKNSNRSSSSESGSRSSTFSHWASFLFSQVIRALIVAVLCFLLLWGPAVGILMSVGTRSGGDWVYGRTWTPQIFKLVLGGVLALLTTPLFVMVWLVRAGWALQTNEGGGVLEPCG